MSRPQRKSRRLEHWSIEDYQRMPSGTALGVPATAAARTVIFNSIKYYFSNSKNLKFWTKVACGMKTT